MKRTLVTVLLSWFVMGLLAFGIASYLDVQAAPATPAQGDTECVLWADIKPWAITRCESWEDNTVCYLATSGFLQCFKED